jgi:hypothetical protein
MFNSARFLLQQNLFNLPGFIAGALFASTSAISAPDTFRAALLLLFGFFAVRIAARIITGLRAAESHRRPRRGLPLRLGLRVRSDPRTAFTIGRAVLTFHSSPASSTSISRQTSTGTRIASEAQGARESRESQRRCGINRMQDSCSSSASTSGRLSTRGRKGGCTRGRYGSRGG